MKKLLLLACMAMTAAFAMAETKTYTDDLIVTINGESTDPQETTVEVEANTDGSINFSLRNFCMGEDIMVGNIVVESIPLGKAARYSTFLYKDEINITPGDIEGVAEEDYLGPMISPVPVYIKGKISDEKLYVAIDIDMSGTIGEIINVNFGSDFPEIPVVSTKTYTDDLVVTINGESTDPMPTTVTVETLESGDINFILSNFSLGEDIRVGNIQVDELSLTPAANYDTFAFTGRIDITPGNIEDVAEDEYLGPMISPVPVNLTGKINDEKLYVTIDIDMMATLGQIIYVSFGYDIPAAYTVTYVLDGEVFSTEKVEEGGKATAPEAPEKEGYTFAGWEGLPETVTADATVTGTYTVNYYTVNYVVDGEVVYTTQVAYGEAIPAYEYTPESDERYTRTFVRWDGETHETMPAHDVTYTAVIDIVDGIQGVSAEAKSETYDLSGRQVKNAVKGIYIVNGKKVRK